MRFVRLFAGSAIVFFLLMTGISLFLPSRVRISRAVNVAASPDLIWSRIDSMQHWKSWNPFFEGADSASIVYRRAADGTVNAMTIHGTSVDWITRGGKEHVASMTRPGKLPVNNGWVVIHHPGSDSTTLQWYMDVNVRWYPWEKFGSIMLERSYGPGMEKGLARLREQFHSRPSNN